MMTKREKLVQEKNVMAIIGVIIMSFDLILCFSVLRGLFIWIMMPSSLSFVLFLTECVCLLCFVFLFFSWSYYMDKINMKIKECD